MSLPRRDTVGAAWLMTDLSLLVCSLSLVKQLGGDYAAIQLVFCRAIIGLVLMVPMLRGQWRMLSRPRHPWLNLARVLLAVAALTANFASVAKLPLSLFTTISFLRPLLLLALAALILRERISRTAWAAAVVGLLGVIVAVQPALAGEPAGVAYALAAVVAGTFATIAMRALPGESPRTLMVYYTAGLAILSMPPAAFAWRPIAPEHWPLILGVGLMAQAGQYCFIRAHQAGSASTLASVGYVQLPLAAIAGYAFFREVPTSATLIGAAIILAANLVVIRRSRAIGKDGPAG